jgi:hypothetical protein
VTHQCTISRRECLINSSRWNAIFGEPQRPADVLPETTGGDVLLDMRPLHALVRSRRRRSFLAVRRGQDFFDPPRTGLSDATPVMLSSPRGATARAAIEAAFDPAPDTVRYEARELFRLVQEGRGP